MELLSHLPHLSLCILAKNAAKVIERVITSVMPHVTDFSLVDDASTDGSIDVARRFCFDKGIDFCATRIHPVTHPHLYRLDVASTFEPFDGAPFPGPFTGRYILSDFAAARNLGWEQCQREWIVTLDCDDVLLNVDEIPANIRWAEEAGTNFLHCHYDISDQQNSHGMRCFAARKESRWNGRVHEHIGAGEASFSGSLFVRDMRDSGCERIPNHYFKIAYLTCQELGWENVGIHELASAVLDMFFLHHPKWQSALDLLKRRAAGTGILDFVEKTTASKKKVIYL